jgi:predicted transcriptional regulator
MNWVIHLRMSFDSISVCDLMSKNVLVAEQDLNIYAICRILSNNNIGCVVIVDDLDTRKPVGIITESDIIKIMGKLDQHQLQIPITHHMSSPVVTLYVQGTVADAMKLMCDKRIRRVVILENDKSVGIVTDKELFILPTIQTNRRNNQGYPKRLHDNPSYGHICKRINKLNIDIKGDKIVDDLIIAVDSTGIKVTNRGQWMNEKWNVQNRKKGYLKIHIAVNIKTKKPLL